MAGVRGKSRLRPAEITVLAVAWAVVPVIMWALAAAGASFALVPHHGADRPRPGLGGRHGGDGQGWRGSAMGLAIAAIGVAGAFAGPAGSWAVAGVGLCAVLLGKAAAVARRQRRMTAVT